MKRFFFVLVVGGIGGVLLNNLLLPALAKVDFLNAGNIFGALYRPAIQTLIRTEEKIITIEPDFWRSVVSKGQGSVGFVQSFKDKAVLAQGAAIALTSDGLLATAPQFVPEGATSYQVFISNKISQGQVVLRDENNSVAFIKIEESGLPVFNFASDVQLGQSVIILGKALRVNEINNFVQLGLVGEIDKKVLLLNTQFSKELNGAGVFTSKGELIGIARSNVRNQIFILHPNAFTKILNDYLNVSKAKI